MKQIFTVFSSVLVIFIFPPNLDAQVEFPGSDAVTKVMGVDFLDTDAAAELCCFAKYGWHKSAILKFNNSFVPLPNNGDGIAERLLYAGVTPQIEEQFFSLEDGSFVIVSSIDNFDKVLDRFLINYSVNEKNK
jgi:hypothetical protein|tara:strand:+ start:133 stop:531 length:399 start_codon:yes stop_codon:yes gene_type:complete